MKKVIILVVVLLLMCSSALAQVEVMGNTVNLREGPGVNYDVVGTVKKGEVFRDLDSIITDERGVDWYWVEYDGQECWISSKYARIVSNDESQPTGAAVSYEYLAGSYWKAYSYIAEAGGRHYSEELPIEYWSVDLFLYEDGTMLLRDWVPTTYEYTIPVDRYTHWSLNGNELYIHPSAEDNDFCGSYALFTGSDRMQLWLDEYGGGMLSLAREDRELFGNECLPQDLIGDWKTVYMTYYGEELTEEDMIERGFEENLLIDMAYDENYEICLQADFVMSYPADSVWTQFRVLPAQELISECHEALADFETLYQDWSANLYNHYDVNGDYGWYLTMIDRNNILLVCVDNYSGDAPVIDVRRLRRLADGEEHIYFETTKSYDEFVVVDQLADTRWVAVCEEWTDYETGEVSITQLPDEYGGYELLLFGDGTAQWQALSGHNGGLACDPNGYWRMHNGQIVFSAHRDLSQSEEWDIIVFDEAENAIIWNVNERRRVILEPATMMEKWQAPAIQSLIDTWTFVYGSTDGWEYTAEEEGDQTQLRFYLNQYGELCMDYESNQGIVTSAKALPTEYISGSESLISGWAPWHVQVDLFNDMKTRIFMPDENTVQLENTYLLDGSPAVSSRIFKRSSEVQ